MRIRIAATAVAAALTLGAATGTAGAATAAPSATPRPSCLIATLWGPCHCPPGWHVVQGAFFYCARNG